MANETKIDAPLTASVGERLTEKAHEGEESGVERAERAVADVEAGARGGSGRAQARAKGRSGASPERRAANRGEEASEERRHPPSSSRATPGRRAGFGWAVAAGLGTLVLAGAVRQAFRR